MISPYNRFLAYRGILHAAQAHLEVSRSHLRRILDHLRRLFIPGGFPILYHQYRFKHGAGAFRSYRGPGVGVYSRLLKNQQKEDLFLCAAYDRRSRADSRTACRLSNSATS